MSTQIIYDNDISPLCRADAESLMSQPEQLLDVLVREDGRASDVSAFLQTLGVPERISDNIEFDLLGKQHTGKQNRQAFVQMLCQTPVSDAQRDAAVDFLSGVMQNFPQIVSDLQERASAKMQANLSMLGIGEDEGFLAISDAWPHLIEVMDDSKELPSALRTIAGYGEHLVVSHEEHSPALMASIDGEERPKFAVIPSSWAKEAYASEKFHDALNEAMDDPFTADFLLSAHAVPEMEKDPATFGLLRGIYQMGRNMTPEYRDNFSRHLAVFDMEDFKEFCKASSFNLEKQMACAKTAEDAYNLEGEVWTRVEPYFFDSLYEGKPPKATPLSRGISAALEASSLDDLSARLSGFLRDEKSAIRQLEKQGRALAPSR